MPIAYRQVITLVLAIFTVCTVNGTELDAPPLGDRALRVWSTNDGLPHNSVNHITQDSQGYLWIASWEGPVRFNGRNFELFAEETGLPDPGSLYVAENPFTKQMISTGTRGGVSYYQSSPTGGYWTPQPRVFDRVDYALFVSIDCTWYATVNTGVVRECGDTRTQYDKTQGLPSAKILELEQDQRGRIWAGTDAGVAYFDAQLNRFRTLEQLPQGYSFGIVAAQDGAIYISIGRAIFVVDPDDLSVTEWPAQYPSTITELYQAPEGSFWVGTHEHGISTLTPSSPQMVTIAEGLPNNHILSIFMDSENTLWVGTHRGLVQFRKAQFHSHHGETGLGYDYVRALTEAPDGSVLVGGLGGIKRIKDEAVLPLDTSSSVRSESILSFAYDRDQRLYIGTYTNGLYVLENGREIAHYNENSGFPGNDIRGLLISGDGYLYAATSVGVLKSRMNDDGTLATPSYFGVDDGLPDEVIYALHQTRSGEILIGSMRGLSKLSNGKIEPIDVSSVSNAEFIFGFYEDEARIYITSDRGLLVYTKKLDRWQVFDADNGLPTIKYFDVTRDHKGDLWLASGRGLIYVAAQDFDFAINDDNPATPLPHTFYQHHHGLASAQINTGGPPMLVTKDGELWVATSRGAGHYSPAQSKAIRQTPPQPVIEKVISDGHAISENTYLEPDSGRIEFQFVGLGYQYSESILYRMQLAGYDEDWVKPTGSQLIASYTELPPGAFIFQVQAAYPSGEWSDSATFTVHKLPTLWQRPSIWVALALASLLLVWLAFQLRIYTVTRSKERLQQLVREQTETLQQLAHQDSLTTLANRRAFDELLRQKVAQHGGQQPLALILMDLDHFKEVNDRYLHTTGDQVLKRVARLIRDSAPESDMIARWGGEEFAILLSGAQTANLVPICERIRTTLMNADLHDLVSNLSVTGSFGGATYHPGETAASLIRRADKALYRAKHNGRNRIEIAHQEE
ncbi:diguanylate cyclase [Pseudidiomarina sp. 1APP75-32.1]|uniref:diguanylate cyclase n=1 Tax=Pseudidiomarina terrestris TaxID=2820060 RepID=A0AAW7QX25_9GAMM|nr:ligand-binding sensor domain-containing diguanylate cyclase [Pseudidiomarina sp. 1APP75-32.1]MDN7124017.1 diguanylate cyclase [Pseudidiomarina sp. 1APP75-32.1]